MNVLRFAAFALVAGIGLVSCEKELGPIIKFDPPVVPTSDTLVDTSYVAMPEAAMPRRVLIEEFTGVTCPNCPAGHQTVKALINGNPDRVSSIGFQVFNFGQANPVPGETRNDNRTQKATDLSNVTFGGILFLPAAAIDRVKDQGLNSMLLSRNLWTSKTTNRMQVAAPLNIGLTSRYDSATREVVLKVRMAYTSAITTKNRLTVAIAENNIIDAQEISENGTIRVINEYEHEHVFRDFITSPVGDPILDSVATKTAGRVLERYFVFKVDARWNPANCVAIAYVHNTEPDNAEILQVAETSLK
jgi:hypothetical protein